MEEQLGQQAAPIDQSGKTKANIGLAVKCKKELQSRHNRPYMHHEANLDYHAIQLTLFLIVHMKL